MISAISRRVVARHVLCLELDLESARHREVQKHVNRVLALFGCDVPDASPDVALERRIGSAAAHDEQSWMSDDTERGSNEIFLCNERLPARRIGKFPELFLRGTQGHVLPGSAVVPEVEMFQGDGGIQAHIVTLPEHLDAAPVTVGEPLNALAVEFWVAVDHGNGIEQYGALCRGGQQLQKLNVLVSSRIVAVEVVQL